VRKPEAVHFRIPFFIVLVGAAWSTNAIAQVQSDKAPYCTADKFEIGLRIQPESAPSQIVGLLAVEFLNRGQEICAMSSFRLEFPPDIDVRPGDLWLPDSSPAAAAFKRKSWLVAPGETVHSVLVWSSKPTRVDDVMMDDCVTRDTMKLYWGLPDDQKPSLEVRHLRMQTCGHLYRSDYRLGPYVAGEPITKQWFENHQLDPAEFTSQVVAAPPLQSGEQFKLHALYDIEYLKGTFESGYSGYFELYLHEHAPAFSNCPFESLHKREADGQTLIYLNHCKDRSTPSESAPKFVRLLIRELGMLPERPGHVEYEATGELVEDDRVTQARSQVELSIREATQPMLPVIDTSTPTCRSSQLNLAEPINLGDHWSEPWTSPLPGDERHDGKVFEFTNVSSQSCLLGGAPHLRALRGAPHLDASPSSEIKAGSLSLEFCRNCPTPLFNPRDSHWFELRPGDSAHFMVARTSFADYFWTCTGIGAFEATLPSDDKAMRLPFETGSCGQVRETAWREGRFDGDPLNVKYDAEQKVREQRRLAAPGPLPKKCEEEVSPDTGRPVMLPSKNGVVWGLSTNPVHYGEPISVLLWLNNPTDEPQSVMTCGGIDYFWARGIDIFDSAGHRVLTRAEEKRKTAISQNPEQIPLPSRLEDTWMCDRNFPITIPPHACMHGTFSSLPYDFSRDLRTYYELPPGRYYIVRKESTATAEKTAFLPDPSQGLAVDVLEP
jgi:hypothetical protein